MDGTTSGSTGYGLWPLVVIHVERREDREALAESGDRYVRYAAGTPAYVPRLRRVDESRVREVGS